MDIFLFNEEDFNIIIICWFVIMDWSSFGHYIFRIDRCYDDNDNIIFTLVRVRNNNNNN